MFLAGDVGATKTSLGVYEISGEANSPLAKATLPSRSYESLTALVTDFLGRNGLTPQHAVLGVAGPIMGDRATITNLSWTVERESLKTSLGLESVLLLNDIECIAYGVPVLKDEDLFTMNPGEKILHGPMAVIAPGTGLGEAYITWDGTGYRAHASEGGHADFAPTCDMEMELLSHLMERFEHVSYERICSGVGIPNIYTFLKQKEYYDEPGWFEQKLHQGTDKTAVIITTALDPRSRCERCEKTLELFLSILGAEAGNMALKLLATGGVYLGGGILPRIISVIKDTPFMASFRAKGRLSHVVEHIPVNLILNPRVALIGAASFGMSNLSVS